jgi:ABC-2 type transport system permease protein
MSADSGSTGSVGSGSIQRLEEHLPLTPPRIGELREVSGPSALGGGRRRAWELLYLIASTEFKRTYFDTALGYLWTIGRPLLVFAVLYEVFTRGLRLGASVPHYPQMLLFNFILFGFFTEGVGTALPSIVSAEAIVRKTQFPRLVIPVSAVLTALFNLGLNMLVVFAFILAAGISPMWTWFLLPVLVLATLTFTIALAMIVSSLYPRYRDAAMIWTVLATALFYAAPVIYVLDRFHHTLRVILCIDPMAVILVAARKWIIDPHALGPAAELGGYGYLLIPAAVFVLICGLAVWTFWREAPRIAEEL